MGSLHTQFPPQFSLNTIKNKETPNKIRAALEEHGFILLKFEDDEYFKEEMKVAMEKFLTLDRETKARCGKAYSAPGEGSPYYEAVTVNNSREAVEKFCSLIWPNGNEKFCEILCSTGEGLFQLAQNIMDTVVNSYGFDNEAMSSLSKATSACRMSRYMPPEKEEAGLGLPAHVDGTYISILCQNEVHGLKLKTRDGNWWDANLEKNTFIVLVGEMLKAWSNGKMVPPVHKVMIGGEIDRCSFALFVVPEQDDVVQVESQLVSNENPTRFRPFLYRDYVACSAINQSVEGTVEKFAGV